MTALHYIVKDVNITNTDYLTDLYVELEIRKIG